MGHKYLSSRTHKQLSREVPRSIREYGHGILTEQKYLDLVNSFTKQEFDLYEEYLRRWGTPGRHRQVLLDIVTAKQLPETIKALAKIRADDLYLHQKIKQCLRDRWTNISDYHKNRINADTDKIWNKIAHRVIGKFSNKRYYSQAWSTKQGKSQLVAFLKELYQKQNGLCAITKQPMTLSIGDGDLDKCSVDRINSDRGYDPDNIQLTTVWVNHMKFNYSMKEFLQRVAIIHQAKLADKR